LRDQPQFSPALSGAIQAADADPKAASVKPQPAENVARSALPGGKPDFNSYKGAVRRLQGDHST
jgi:hypothetical protein